MEVQQHHAMFGGFVSQAFHDIHEFRQRDAELRLVTTRLRPFAGARRAQPDAHAELRRRARFVGEINQFLELRELLHDRDDVLAEFLAGQDQRQHRAILNAVAHQRRFVLFQVRERRHEFGA
jgi:hypothetical protein